MNEKEEKHEHDPLDEIRKELGEDETRKLDDNGNTQMDTQTLDGMLAELHKEGKIEKPTGEEGVNCEISDGEFSSKIQELVGDEGIIKISNNEEIERRKREMMGNNDEGS